MIRETCSCGATFEVGNMKYSSHESSAASAWRVFHKCVEPVTLTATVEQASGPGLAEVELALLTIAERVALIARKMPEPGK